MANSFGSATSAVATVLITNVPLPSIALTAPVNGASYVAPVTIPLAASVTANGHTITQVQFYNGATLLGSVAAAPYSLSWTNINAGSFSLTAQAVYDSGSTVASTPANVTVTNGPLPAVALTAPVNGASYGAPAAISLAASVTANGHAITKVQFYNGATLLAEAAAAWLQALPEGALRNTGFSAYSQALTDRARSSAAALATDSVGTILR